MANNIKIGCCYYLSTRRKITSLSRWHCAFHALSTIMTYIYVLGCSVIPLRTFTYTSLVGKGLTLSLTHNPNPKIWGRSWWGKVQDSDVHSFSCLRKKVYGAFSSVIYNLHGYEINKCNIPLQQEVSHVASKYLCNVSHLKLRHKYLKTERKSLNTLKSKFCVRIDFFHKVDNPNFCKNISIVS